MKMSGKIVVVGSTDTDMVASGARIPKIGETVPGGAFMMTPGGKGANQAVAVARLAGPGRCVFVAKVGDDDFGREAVTRFADEGMDAKLIVDPVAPTGAALVFVDEQGRNSIRVILGANGTMTPDDVAQYADEIEAADTVLLQLETPMETVAAVAARAHRAGARVVVNPAPAQEMPASLYADADILTPNETEAQILTGVEVVDDATAQRACDVLHARGTRTAVITLGGNGAYYSAPDGRGHVPPVPVKAIDTVGAGDTFNGALVVALSEGKGLADAIRFACRAAAISVTRPGAQVSVPYRREVE